MKYLLKIISTLLIIFLALLFKKKNQNGWIEKKEYLNENRNKKRMG